MPPHDTLRWSPPVPIGSFPSNFVNGTFAGRMCHSDFEDADVTDERYRKLVQRGIIGEDWPVSNL